MSLEYAGYYHQRIAEQGMGIPSEWPEEGDESLKQEILQTLKEVEKEQAPLSSSLQRHVIAIERS